MDYGNPARPVTLINSNTKHYTQLDSMLKGILKTNNELIGLSRRYLADDNIKYQLTLYKNMYNV